MASLFAMSVCSLWHHQLPSGYKGYTYDGYDGDDEGLDGMYGLTARSKKWCELMAEADFRLNIPALCSGKNINNNGLDV